MTTATIDICECGHDENAVCSCADDCRTDCEWCGCFERPARQRVWVKHYIRRDGEHMIYVNGTHGTSLGWSGDRSPSRYGKGMTNGKRNLMDAFFAAMRECEATELREGGHRTVAEGIDFDSHVPGVAVHLDFGDLYVVDDGTVGGVANSYGDGVFLHKDGKLMNINDIR